MLPLPWPPLGSSRDNGKLLEKERVICENPKKKKAPMKGLVIKKDLVEFGSFGASQYHVTCPKLHRVYKSKD